MKISNFIELLSGLEGYELVISEYSSVVMNEDGKNEEYFLVLDDPIVGVITNEDNKEVRLVVSRSEERAVKEIENGKKWRPLI
jgi:hypothetical protein